MASGGQFAVSPDSGADAVRGGDGAERWDMTIPMGIWDRAIIEVLCFTGMRRMKVIGLGWNDIDAERGTVLVCEGKRKVAWMVPIEARR